MKLKTSYKQTEIGVIPEDWEVEELNSVVNITRLAGYEYSTVWEESENGEIIALRGFNIGKNKIIERDFVRISNKLSMKLIRSRLFKGDVVYPCVGTIGNAVVIEEDDKYHIQQNIAKITPLKNALNSHFLAYYLMSNFGFKEIEKFNGSSSQPNILVGSLRKYSIILPPLPEQTAIAAALSDVDALMGELDKLIAKKRDIKQATMQQLLTGKKRLAGFSGEWENVMMEKILVQRATYGVVTAGNFVDDGIKMIRGGDISNGQVLTDLPMLSNQKAVEYKRTCLTKNDVVIALVGYPGATAKIPDILIGANISRAVGLLRLNESKVFSDYIVQYLNFEEGRKKVLAPSAGSAQQVVNLAALNKLHFFIPTIEEQTAIATILSDMDAEITQLEARRAKTAQLKQGMMQELLTGKTRLI
jgi:type I restriction enzyme S subunit